MITNLWIKAEKEKARWILAVLRYSSYSLMHESKRLKEKMGEWRLGDIENEQGNKKEIHQAWIHGYFSYSCIHGVENIFVRQLTHFKIDYYIPPSFLLSLRNAEAVKHIRPNNWIQLCSSVLLRSASGSLMFDLTLWLHTLTTDLFDLQRRNRKSYIILWSCKCPW